MSVFTQVTNHSPSRSTALPVWHFTLALLRASVRDIRSAALALLTPLLMLIIFYLADPDSLGMMTPLALSFTVAFSGIGLAQKVVAWREQDIFRRLACTPVSLGRLALGIGLAQLTVSLVQTTAVLLVAVLGLGVKIDWSALPLVVAGVLLSLACFIAYGLFLAGVVRKVESVTTLFMFTFMPALFLGVDFLNVPAAVKTAAGWLPPALFTDLTNPLFGQPAPEAPLLRLAALAGFSLLFLWLAARTFRWES